METKSETEQSLFIRFFLTRLFGMLLVTISDFDILIISLFVLCQFGIGSQHCQNMAVSISFTKISMSSHLLLPSMCYLYCLQLSLWLLLITIKFEIRVYLCGYIPYSFHIFFWFLRSQAFFFSSIS